MDKTFKKIFDEMDLTSKEVWLNCKEQDLVDYIFKAYYEIHMRDIEIKSNT